MLRVALIDLDDTLYAPQTGLWTLIGERIERYMIERVGLAAETVPALRRRYLEQFGTSLNGLRLEHAIDAAGYLRYVHDLPLEQVLPPNPALNAMLGRLPLTKAIFTNADAGHAQRVTARLGIAQHFPTIVDIETLNFRGKPAPEAYVEALALVGAAPEECVFVDDSARNLKPAHDLGLMTVLVGGTFIHTPGPAPAPDGENQGRRLEQERAEWARSSSLDGVDFVIANILELEAVLVQSGRLPRRVATA